MSKTKKPRLGRGLSSLMNIPVSVTPINNDTNHPASPIAQSPTDQSVKPTQLPTQSSTSTQPHPDTTVQSTADNYTLSYISLDAITPNPYQPRQQISDDTINQLAASIKQDGLMQPIVVRPTATPNQYQLVAGERRWRAAQTANLTQLPAIIHDLTDQQLAEWAIIENLQRQDLNPIERAHAFQRLIDNFHMTHDNIANRVGIERPTVSNSLRLLDLHEEIQLAITTNLLTAGHGRALLPITEPNTQLAIARRAIASAWSVRTTELTVRRLINTANPTINARIPKARSPHLDDLEQQIAAALQTKVHIKTSRKKGSGSLIIEFYDLDQFDDLLKRLGIDIN